jgi:hypothetical protein
MIYLVVYLCQLLIIVTRIRYYCLLVSIRYYSSVIIRCSIILLHFHLSFILIVA